MKKILLTLTALAAVVTLSAQEAAETSGSWEATLAPVSKAENLAGVHVAQAADGSVYASSTYDQTFTFASKQVENADEMTSAVIVKYDNTGKEQWAVTLYGAATVTALAADTDGTLYAAGLFEEEVTITDAAGNSANLTASFNVQPAFILKVSADGKVAAQKTIAPETDATIAAAMGPDPWADDPENADPVPLYSGWDPITVTPHNIQIDGNKIYVAATYWGDVVELGWEGAYIDLSLYGMGYVDNNSIGVFSLNKADLSGATSVAYVQSTEAVSMDQFYPESLNFAVQNGTVYLGFFGFGNLSLTTPAEKKDFTFENDGEGNREHALVLTKIDGGKAEPNVFHAAANEAFGRYNIANATLADGVLYLAGTFYGNFPLDTKVTTEANTAFAAAIDPAGSTAKWATALSVASATASAALADGKLTLATTAGTYYIDAATGTQAGEPLAELKPADIAVAGSYTASAIAGEDGKVTIIASQTDDDADAIKAVTTATAAEHVRYNLAGQRVSAAYKGIVVENGRKLLVK